MKKLLLATLISIIALTSCSDNTTEPKEQTQTSKYDNKILTPSELNFDKETRVVLKDFYFVEKAMGRTNHCYVTVGQNRYTKNDTMYVVQCDSIVGVWTNKNNFKLLYFRWNIASQITSEFFTSEIKDLFFEKIR